MVRREERKTTRSEFTWCMVVLDECLNFFFDFFLAYKFFGSYHFSAFSIFLVPGVYLCPELASMHKYILVFVPKYGRKSCQICQIMLYFFVKYCCTLSNYVALYAYESHFVRGYKNVAFCLISKYVYVFMYIPSVRIRIL